MCLSVRGSQNKLMKMSAHACCAKLPRTRYRKVDGAFFFFFKERWQVPLSWDQPFGSSTEGNVGHEQWGQGRVGIAIKVGRFSREDAFSSSLRQTVGRIPFPQREDSLNDDGQLLWL